MRDGLAMPWPARPITLFDEFWIAHRERLRIAAVSRDAAPQHDGFLRSFGPMTGPAATRNGSEAARAFRAHGLEPDYGEFFPATELW